MSYLIASSDGPLHRSSEQPSLPTKVPETRTPKRPDVVQESKVQESKSDCVTSYIRRRHQFKCRKTFVWRHTIKKNASENPRFKNRRTFLWRHTYKYNYLRNTRLKKKLRSCDVIHFTSCFRIKDWKVSFTFYILESKIERTDEFKTEIKVNVLLIIKNFFIYHSFFQFVWPIYHCNC